MSFEIEGKIAIVTGGASGIGLHLVKGLLRNGIRGVTIADVNAAFGKEAMKDILSEFGENKAIFIQTDVSNYEQFHGAFKKTIEEFQNIDILINNAAIMDDTDWQHEIAVNLNGLIHGMILGTDMYLPKFKQGTEAVIVNIGSTAGIHPYGHMPVYCSTKHALVGATRSWGLPFMYERSHVRVIGICPGFTETPVIHDLERRNMGGKYREWFENSKGTWMTQEPDHLAKEVMTLIRRGTQGSVWVVEDGKPTYEYVFPHRSTMTKNILGE